MDEELDSLAAIANAIKKGNQLLADTIKDIVKGKVEREVTDTDWVSVEEKDLMFMADFQCQHFTTVGSTCFEHGRDDSCCDSCWARRWARSLLDPALFVEEEDEEVNPNENVLEGFRCPECGSYGPYRIAADAFFEVHDDGTDHHENVEWNDDSVCICKDCGFNGTVAAFELPELPKTKKKG